MGWSIFKLLMQAATAAEIQSESAEAAAVFLYGAASITVQDPSGVLYLSPSDQRCLYRQTQWRRVQRSKGQTAPVRVPARTVPLVPLTSDINVIAIHNTDDTM